MKKILYLSLLLLSFSCKKTVSDAFVGDWKAYTVTGQKINEFQKQEARDMYGNYTLNIARDGVNYMVVENGGPTGGANSGMDKESLKLMTHHTCILFDQTNTLIGRSGKDVLSFTYSSENDEIVALLWGQPVVFKRK
jgi:hypothetical protein